MNRSILAATLCLNFSFAYGTLPDPDSVPDAMDAETASPATAPVTAITKWLPKIDLGQLRAALPDASSVVELFYPMCNGNFPKIQEESARLGLHVPNLYECSRLQFLQAVIFPYAAAWQLFMLRATDSPMLSPARVFLERPFYSSNCDVFVDGLNSILEKAKSLVAQSFGSMSTFDYIKEGVHIIGDRLHLTDLESFKGTTWPSLVKSMGEMLNFESKERDFFLSAGLNAIVCRQGSAQHTRLCAEYGLNALVSGFYNLEKLEIVILGSHRNILHTAVHEAGHAFAYQQLGGDIGEFYSVFFEMVGTIIAVDLRMLSKSDAIRWFIGRCEDIFYDLAPIYESLDVARNMASLPELPAGSYSRSGFVEYTDGLMSKYVPWMSGWMYGVKKNSAEELLEGRLRYVTSEIFGMRNRSTGEYYERSPIYDPVYYENHGTGAINALMTLRHVEENYSGRLSFADIMASIKECGETCLHRFADVTPENVIPALEWLYARTIGRFEQ
ncbi:MAG: hypothetical protein LBJ03_00800 [Holosporales bacterium]|jgi:hypothetical protein|nr:hypothetical protein [Holosporales bacterium]